MALKKRQFKVLYQPQLCLKTGEIYGVEALIRWEHPDLGLVSPLEFIPQLEYSGKISNVGEWLMDEVCQQIIKWDDSQCPPFIVSINISAYQLYDKEFVEIIAETINKYQIPFERITLEITESNEIKHESKVIHKLNVLKS